MPVQDILDKIKNGGQPSAYKNILNKTAAPQSFSDKTPSFEQDEDAVPFGALGVTKDGQAYYGEGFHGWIRKTYGDIFDPAKRLRDATDEDMTEFQTYVQNYEKKFEQNDFWNKWGERIFGLSAREAGTALASLNAPAKIMGGNLQEQVDAGEISQSEMVKTLAGEGVSQSFNIMKDLGQRTLWGGLEILGLTDVGMRKLSAVRLGLDDLADKYGEPDENVNFFSSLRPEGFGSNFAAFLDTRLDMGVFKQAKDFLTVAGAVGRGELTVKEVLERTYGSDNKYMRGSNAIYTIAADEAVRREFKQRVAMGEDPGYVAAELGRAGLEFTGSVLGDPATYLGMGLVKPKVVTTPVKLFGREIKLLGNVPRIGFERIGKIPSFGELVGLTLGDARMEANAASHFFSFANREAEIALRNGFDNGEEAIRYFDDAVRKVVSPGEVAAQGGQKIKKTGIGDFTSKIEDVRKVANKNQYRVTSYTARAKVNLAARDVSLVMDMIHSGSGANVNTTLDTIADLRTLYSPGVDMASRINAGKRLALKGAVTADGKITGHGALFFSEAGMVAGDMFARLSPDKIDDIFRKYADQPIELQNQLYKLLDNAFQEIFPSVDEMADAKKLVRAGNIEPKNLELAKRYDDLPASVRNISKVHRQTSKLVGASTGMQVNLYMRFSPGYFARNIFGQGAGLLTDMGVGMALKTSATAWWKPVVELLSGGKLTPATKHVLGRVEQVASATGVAPHKMLEGVAGITGGEGMKKATAFLKAAQQSEIMTSADIMAETIFDELHKALPAVMNGDGSVRKLVEAGTLNEKQANALVKLVSDFHGNTSQAINAFKKIFGAQAEVWRLEPLPEGVTDILKRTGDFGEVQRLQLEAASRDEFVNGVSDVLRRIEDTVRKNAADEIPTLDSDAMRQMGDVVNDAIDLMNNGNFAPADVDYITRITQGWQNVRRHLDEATTLVRDELVRASMSRGVDTAPYTKRIEKVKAAFEKTHPIRNSVNETAWKMVDALNGRHHVTGEAVEMLTPQQVWERFQVGGVFDIRKEFPNPPASVREAVDQVHRATKYFTADFWRTSNNTLYDETLKVFNEWAAAAGTTLDDVAAMHNLPNDPFRLLQKSYYEAQRLEVLRPDAYQKLAQAPFKGATLDDMIFSEGQVDAAGKEFNKRYVFNAVNAERKAQGLIPYATSGEVPWDEVQKVMRSRMGRFATPAEIVKKVNAKLGKAEKVKKVALTAETELDELPKPVLEKVQLLAKKMLDELSGGKVEKGAGGERLGSTNIEWWKELSGQNKKRDAVEKALTKIAEGKDGGTANVQRVKGMIFDRLRYGDPITGTPPDMYALQQIGADKKTMQETLADFNEITKNNFTLDEAIEASMPSDEALARTADMPFYNEAGQLIQPKRYARVQDIPDELVKGAVEPERFPPPMNDEFITTARAYVENLDGFMEEATRWTRKVSDNWGVTERAELPENLEDALSGWKKVVDDRMQYAKDKAMVVAGMKRDFLLHDYNKTYADVALAYLMPFSYWHTRTYARWAERLVDNPKWANAYMAYKRKMEKEHADSPEWWRQNVGIQIPGLMKNPVYLNLEATINPLNGLTGVDFNDPYKRVDWLSRTVDDMGKMGPAFAAPLNWAVAGWLYAKGEEEAGKRWLGRLIPQTMQAKGLLTAAGLDLNMGPFVKNNELDPFVNLTSDGLDPYELNRVNRHLAQLVENEPDPAKRQLLATQAVDAARLHEGPLWEQARKNALNERAGGQMASYLFGVGFKPRTEEDMKVDQFYGEYFKLLKLRDMMSSQEYRESWDRLRDKYAFADSLIIGKKADPERDSAFAYNVLGRIPPGQMGDLFEQVGLSNEDINRFYETKGDFENWTEGDQKRFMAAVVDLSAVLQMPQLATRQEWNKVKTDYQSMKDAVAADLGKDIWEKVQIYYDLKNDARYKGNAYLHDHPEVARALDLQTQMTVGNQLLYKYYGSINTLQSYYNGEARKELEAKYGQGIYEAYYAYLDAPTQEQKKAIQSKFSQLKAFMKEKSGMKDPINRAIVNMALMLPDKPMVEYRSDLEEPTTAQQNLINTLNIPQSVDPQVLWQNASPALAELVTGYWMNGDELPYAAYSNLDYLAEQFGISGDEALQLMGISLQRP